MTTGTRVQGKAAIVVGGGQTPGETIGNGRATAVVLVTLGAEMLYRVNQFATSTQAPPQDIFDSAMWTGNVIRDRDTLFLSRLVALTGTSLVVEPQEPLSRFVADTASVASTVTPVRLSDALRLFIINRRDRCREAANVVFVRKN